MRNLSNYTKIANAQNSKMIQHTSFIMLSNCNINDNKNIDTTLTTNISSTQTTISLNADYTGFTGYVIIGDEILKVTNTSGTTMTVVRGQYGTVAQSHLANDIVRDGQRIQEVKSWSYNDRSESSQSDLFAPVLSTATIRIEDNISKYDVDSSTKVYNIQKNKYVYIFDGADGQVLCEFVGSIFRGYSQDAFEYIIELKDKLSEIWDEAIDLNLNFSNTTIKNVLSQVLNIPQSYIQYMNGTIESDYFKVDEISTNEFENYSDFLQTLCRNNLFRMIYTYDGKIKIFSDVFNDNIAVAKNINSQYFSNLSASSDDNKIIINKVKCEYKERTTLFNREDFISGSTLKYVNFRYSQPVYLQLVDSNGFKPNTIIISGGLIDKIDYVSNKYYLLLKDNITGDEFYCGAVDINVLTGEIILVGGYDLDKDYIQRGKLNYLISQGYSSLRNFTLYFSQYELPTVFAINIDNKDSYNLQVPILPNETIKYNCSFGSPEVDNKEFTGIIKEIENIYNVTLTNSQLKYLRRYTQGDGGIPVYIQTNKIGLNGTGESQNFGYSSFDNSNIQVVIEKATNTEDDFNLYVKNTLTGTYTTFTPTDTISKTLQVTNINSFNTGDVITLNSVNNTIANNQSLYIKLKGEKWIIKSKFIDGSNHYIVLDKPFPIGDDKTQFVCDLYPYSSIILLNSFEIKGNPVLETIQNIESVDNTSINRYGKREYILDGTFLNIVDLEYAVDYLKNGFKYTNEGAKKRYIEFKMPFNLDLEVLDVIQIKDSVRLNINNKKFIITERSADCVGTVEFSFKAISLNEYDVTGESFNIENTIKYLPVAIPTYNHYGNSGLSTEIVPNLDNTVISLESPKIGLITALKIGKGNYKAISGTNIRDGVSTLLINNITGDLSTYNLLLLYNGKQSIIKINNEFLLIEGTEIITSSTTSTTVKVIERDIFKTGETEISIGQEIEFCQILQISNENGMYMTNTIIGDKANDKYIEFSNGQLNIRGEVLIGGNTGQINFTDSDLILNDIYGTFASLPFYGFSFGRTFTGDVENIYKNNLLSVGDFTSGTASTTLFGLGNNLTQNLFIIDNSNFLADVRFLNGTTYKKININGLTVPDNRGVDILSNGLLSFHEGELWCYKSGSWVQLT